MKNIEIELKYKIDDAEQMREKILELGAEFIKEYHCVDTYYIVPKNEDGRKYLRLREHDGTAEINYHYAQSDTKTDEWETEVKSAAIMSFILQQLGYKIDTVVDKIRKTYSYKNSEIVLDEVKDLGSFIEIESPDEQELKSIAKALDLKDSQLIHGAGYSDLMRGRSYA